MKYILHIRNEHSEKKEFLNVKKNITSPSIFVQLKIFNTSDLGLICTNVLLIIISLMFL